LGKRGKRRKKSHIQKGGKGKRESPGAYPPIGKKRGGNRKGGKDRQRFLDLDLGGGGGGNAGKGHLSPYAKGRGVRKKKMRRSPSIAPLEKEKRPRKEDSGAPFLEAEKGKKKSEELKKGKKGVLGSDIKRGEVERPKGKGPDKAIVSFRALRIQGGKGGKKWRKNEGKE